MRTEVDLTKLTPYQREVLTALVRPPVKNVVVRLQRIVEAMTEVAPLSWTPDFLSFRSPQWQRSTPVMCRSSAGR
jgi:hypothetical protein